MKSRTWEYIGGNQWSLMEKTDLYENSVATVETKKGYYPFVAYVTGGIDKDELQGLLEIIKEEYD